jgi:hypothetical protein
LWPESNLCGLLAFLYAIPIGGAIGALVGGITAIMLMRSR